MIHELFPKGLGGDAGLTDGANDNVSILIVGEDVLGFKDATSVLWSGRNRLAQKTKPEGGKSVH
jgi:hypothetical protein